jgi:hypothetical protein
MIQPRASEQHLGILKGMDLPAGTIPEPLQQLIEIIRGLLGALIGADVTGDETIANRQQIHTHTCARVRPRLGASHRSENAEIPVHH